MAVKKKKVVYKALTDNERSYLRKYAKAQRKRKKAPKLSKYQKWRKAVDKKVAKRQREQKDLGIDKLIGKPYSVFLKSDYWKGIRLQILKRDNYQCTVCGEKRTLEVHHSTYKHHYMEHKHLNDLHVLCRGCHQLAHETLDIK